MSNEFVFCRDAVMADFGLDLALEDTFCRLATGWNAEFSDTLML